ncbi:MAG: hypothetical protein F4Z28_13750 [Gammaproteobacteria bacterium]|nr:hypothetical protein [Gammaproteobacteria bacterium]
MERDRRLRSPGRYGHGFRFEQDIGGNGCCRRDPLGPTALRLSRNNYCVNGIRLVYHATNRLRDGASAYRPLEVPAQVEECFDHVLATAQAIDDPFEQALFCLVQLPYLQAFDDVNKRVSRLAANIPFIKNNLSPLSFNDVPRDYYSDAVLLVYEQNDTLLLKNLFLWAYERSAGRYGAVRQSVGGPDPFRLRHREALRELVGEVVRNCLDLKSAATRVAAWVAANIEAGERDRFREIAETELLGLHEGNYARYRVSSGQFDAWREVWDGRR